MVYTLSELMRYCPNECYSSRDFLDAYSKIQEDFDALISFGKTEMGYSVKVIKDDPLRLHVTLEKSIYDGRILVFSSMVYPFLDYKGVFRYLASDIVSSLMDRKCYQIALSGRPFLNPSTFTGFYSELLRSIISKHDGEEICLRDAISWVKREITELEVLVTDMIYHDDDIPVNLGMEFIEKYPSMKRFFSYLVLRERFI